MAKIKEGPPFNTGSKHVALHASLLPRDQDLLVWITEYLGCNRSEAVRTSIRMAAGMLAKTQRD
jgi:hypothetical protein